MRAYDAGKDVDLAAAASEVARWAEEEAPRTSCCSEVNRKRVARRPRCVCPKTRRLYDLLMLLHLLGPAELLDEASRPLMASVAGNAFLETKVQSTLLRIKHERSRGRLPLETSSRAGEK